MILFEYNIGKYLKIQDYLNRIFYLFKKKFKPFLFFKVKFLKLKEVTMINILIVLIFLIVFLVLLTPYFINSNRNKRSVKKIITSPRSTPSLKEEKFNPDISTDNWDLHKLRLEKFRRSQYKGLTFFLSPENRIYYLSEKGAKVYC